MTLLWPGFRLDCEPPACVWGRTGGRRHPATSSPVEPRPFIVRGGTNAALMMAIVTGSEVGTGHGDQLVYNPAEQVVVSVYL